MQDRATELQGRQGNQGKSEMAESETADLLRLKSLTKEYPGVIANEDISLTIKTGEVHALLGENGAGKSTLVKMIYGLEKPDAGLMHLNGKLHLPQNPKAARQSGVAMVFQHFSLFEALNVAENVALGMDAPPKMTQLSKRIADISQDYGLPLDPLRRVADLSAGERQRVEIIRCLLQNPKLLIMDEPTSVLTPQEVAILFKTLHKLKKNGTSILYISHKLEEIRALCDHATILRRGKLIGTCTPKTTSARAMAEMMVGSSLHTPKKLHSHIGDTLLSLKNLNVPAPSELGCALKKINLELREGEILGIGGIAGNGQDEILSALSGEILSSRGSVAFLNKDISQLSPTRRRVMGLLTAPEKRLGHAAVPSMSLTDNAALTGTQRKKLAQNGFLSKIKSSQFADEIINAFDVRTPNNKTAASALSGGNLQKFVIGREILQDPKVLIVNQPTWGVDAAAAASIRQALLDIARDGAGVIVISQDLDELMEISDRFAALNEGRLSASRETKELSVDQIGLMLGGAEAARPKPSNSDARAEEAFP